MSKSNATLRGLTSTVTFPLGNIAPEGSVIKSTAIDPEVIDDDGVYRNTGKARVFNSENDAMRSIKSTGPLILYSISPYLRRPADPFFNKPKFSIKGFLNSFNDFVSGEYKKSLLIIYFFSTPLLT